MNLTTQSDQKFQSVNIQIDQERKCSLLVPLSFTAADIRALLVERKVKLPKIIHFLNAEGYPVLIGDESKISLDKLVVMDDTQCIIHLKTEASSSYRSFIVSMLGAVILLIAIMMAYPSKTISPSIIGPPVPSSKIIADDIIENQSGKTILVKTDDNAATIGQKNSIHSSFGVMYNEWKDQRETLKKDYEWYNTMKSGQKCAGHFDERLVYSMKAVKDTPEAIRKFTEAEYEAWPEVVRKKIDPDSQQKGAISENVDNFGQEAGGKITNNLYVVTWRRDDDGNVEIHTFATIFERTTSSNCRFNEEFWNGKREKIENAKKYYLMQKMENNPVYRPHLLE